VSKNKYINRYGQHQIDNSDIKEVVKVLKSDFLTQGPFVEKFEKEFSKYVGSKEVVACSSGTAAIHLSLIALGIKKDDFVIIPSVTFLSSASCVKLLGGKIIFADVNPKTGLVEAENLLDVIIYAKKRRLLNRIKAFIPVHLNGQCADLDVIKKICLKYRIKIIEDSCHALGTNYRPKNSRKMYSIGSCNFSNISTFSFHPVKVIAMGEGGAISLNNKKIADNLRVLRNHGILKSQNLFKNKIKSQAVNNSNNQWYYEVQNLGFNYRVSDISCALGISQLKKINSFIKKRSFLVNLYNKKILSLFPFVEVLHNHKFCKTSWHIYVVLINFKMLNISKSKFAYLLKKNNIGFQVHYVPLIYQPVYKNEIMINKYPGAKEYYFNAMTLPLSVNMSAKHVNFVFKILKEIIEKHKIS